MDDAAANAQGASNEGAESNVPVLAEAWGQRYGDMPSLKDVPVAEKPELFRKKMFACRTIFSFSSEQFTSEKDAKRVALLDIVEHANQTKNAFSDVVMADVTAMVAHNIFRSLPSKRRGIMSVYDPEDEEPSLEPSWPHLQIVYEFFLRFVVSNDVDPKVAKRYIDWNFVLKLLELFDTEDPRERDYLKTILHRLYGKFMALRQFVRKSIQQVFFKVIYESDLHSGIGELLEILGSIINGFALPLKSEHKEFLVDALIPLHKVKSLNSFHQQLAYCMSQFAEKDPRLVVDILRAMLRFWPVTITAKQVLFLNELEEIMELTQTPEFSRIMEPLFERIAKCITCPHFQVAERVLFLWNNDYIVKLINHNRATLFPLVVGALYQNSKTHWNTAVHGLTFNVLKLVMEADPHLFDQCSSAHQEVLATQAASAEAGAAAAAPGADALDPTAELGWEALRKAYVDANDGQDLSYMSYI